MFLTKAKMRDLICQLFKLRIKGSELKVRFYILTP